jgi:hypothetical protein
MSIGLPKKTPEKTKEVVGRAAKWRSEVHACHERANCFPSAVLLAELTEPSPTFRVCSSDTHLLTKGVSIQA